MTSYPFKSLRRDPETGVYTALGYRATGHGWTPEGAMRDLVAQERRRWDPDPSRMGPMAELDGTQITP